MVIANLVQQQAEVVESGRYVGMVGTARLLIERQCPLEERTCEPKLTAILVQLRQVVERLSEQWIVGAQLLLADRQRAPVQRFGLRVVSLDMEEQSEIVG